jgi:hypothetical protein
MVDLHSPDIPHQNKKPAGLKSPAGDGCALVLNCLGLHDAHIPPDTRIRWMRIRWQVPVVVAARVAMTVTNGV